MINRKPSAQIEDARLGIQLIAAGGRGTLDIAQRAQLIAPLLHRDEGQGANHAGREVGYGGPGGSVKGGPVHNVVVGLVTRVVRTDSPWCSGWVQGGLICAAYASKSAVAPGSSLMT